MANQHGTVAAGKRSAVVIYDRQSGDIVHVHECWVEKGVRSPSKRTLAKDAMAHARVDREFKPRSLATLHVDPKRLVVAESETLRIDVKRKRLRRIQLLRAGRPMLR